MDNKYAVFAVRPLAGERWEDNQPPSKNTLRDFLNLQRAHEHIFFCNNGKIERNVGFGPNGRFSEEIISEDYVVVDNQQYDSNIMSRVLSADQCYISDDSYNFIRNNCQDFAERIRREYARRVEAKQQYLSLDGLWNDAWGTGTWRIQHDLTSESFTVLLPQPYQMMSGRKGPYEGRFIKKNEINVRFYDDPASPSTCCTATVSSNGRELKWSNGGTWSR